MTTLSLIRSIVARFDGVFHVSEVKREVWRLNPKVPVSTISTNLHYLVHRHKELESPMRFHYRRKI